MNPNVNTLRVYFAVPEAWGRKTMHEVVQSVLRTAKFENYSLHVVDGSFEGETEQALVLTIVDCGENRQHLYEMAEQLRIRCWQKSVLWTVTPEFASWAEAS